MESPDKIRNLMESNYKKNKKSEKEMINLISEDEESFNNELIWTLRLIFVYIWFLDFQMGVFGYAPIGGTGLFS